MSRRENPSRVALYNVNAETVFAGERIHRIAAQGFISGGPQRNTRVKAIFFIDADGEFDRVTLHGLGRSRVLTASELANDWMDLSDAASAALEDALC